MASPALPVGSKGALDRRLVLLLGGAVLLVIVLVSLIAPTEATRDPRPSSYNAGPAGTKAAYLTLEALGQPVARRDESLDGLDRVDAAHTTLIVPAPGFTALNKDRLAATIRAFLQRGGRVLITGSEGALLLPGGQTKGSSRFGQLCYTSPAGPGRLAHVGTVEMVAPVYWSKAGADVFVEQRCGTEPVVVRVPVGAGEAVWWSSPAPMTNAELHNDADLKLLLASLGTGRRVLFDESLLHPVQSQWSVTRGLPLWWMLGQGGAVFLLMVFSFSRRRGPVRLPEGVPRSSPLEFAASMGDLYGRAGATAAATEAARRRFERMLVYEAKLADATVAAGPEAIREALQRRFGGDWTHAEQHLREAADAVDTELRPGSALKLVRALGEDAERIQQAMQPAASPGMMGQAVPARD